jgi:hypothetical protein
MTKPADAGNGKTPRWIKVLLFASLSMNLLVVGLVAGTYFRHAPSGRYDDVRYSPLRELGYGPFIYALSPSDKKAIGRSWSERSGDLRANRDEVRAQFRALLGLLRKTPFEIEAVQDIVQNQQVKLSERQKIGQQMLLDRIAAMTGDERAEFARRLERSLSRSFRRN